MAAGRRVDESEIEALYHYAPVGLCLFDRELRYRRINQRLAEIHGYSVDAHIGRTLRDMVPGIADAAEPLLLDLLQTGEPRLDVELTGDTNAAPGVIRTWNEHWWPVRDEAGAVVGVNVAVEDITDRKRLEEELLHANRVKDEFLAILSHELRAPLNTILGWAQLMARGPQDPANARRAAEAIERAARMQQTLVGDLLDVSAIVAGKMRLERRQASITQALRAAVDSVRAAAEAKRIGLHLVIESDETIEGDPNRLQQIFWNLLSNAVKFTPIEGRVTASVRRVDSEVEVCVEDSGRGIPSEFLPQVFDRFRQHSLAHGGLGLGLAIVRHLAERHGGRVYADSPGEGRGATFTVRLPLPRHTHKERE